MRADMETYQVFLRYAKEQIVLNNFIREHLGLPSISDTNFCYDPTAVDSELSCC